MKAFVVFVVVLAVLGTLICAALGEETEASAGPAAASRAMADEEPVDLPLPCVPLVLFGFGGFLMRLGNRNR
jgi:hypothetical protein